jgi:radical SAM superfamily enzyme YgiQ (UPF0313 family)
MRVLLVSPPHRYGSKSRVPTYLPLGLAYIAACARDRGHHVQVLDAWAHDLSRGEVRERLAEMSWDVAGISALSTQYRYVKWVAAELKRLRPAPVVLGGALASFSPHIVLRATEVDICVVREGEATFVELLENLDRRQHVPGIWHRTEDESHRNDAREPIEDLDALPFPARDLFPQEVYLRHASLDPGRRTPRVTNVVTGRGCPYGCRYCSKVMRGLRLRSIDSVIEEVRALIAEYQIGGIDFNDELLTVSKERAHELCDKIGPLGIGWQCQGRADVVDYQLLRTMRRAGCVCVGFGVESGSQKILDAMNKGVTVEQSVAAVNAAMRAGLHVQIQMMFGYPGDDQHTLAETVAFAARLHDYAYRPSLFITTPLPGAPLYHRARRDGLIPDEEGFLESLEAGYEPDGPVLVNMTQFSDEEFLRLKAETEARIGAALRRQLMTNPISMARYGVHRVRRDGAGQVLRAVCRKVRRQAR